MGWAPGWGNGYELYFTRNYLFRNTILQTFCFSAPGDEFLFSTFMRACFDFLRQKNGGGGAGPAPPHARTLLNNTNNIHRCLFTILKEVCVVEIT